MFVPHPHVSVLTLVVGTQFSAQVSVQPHVLAVTVQVVFVISPQPVMQVKVGQRKVVPPVAPATDSVSSFDKILITSLLICNFLVRTESFGFDIITPVCVEIHFRLLAAVGSASFLLCGF